MSKLIEFADPDMKLIIRALDLLFQMTASKSTKDQINELLLNLREPEKPMEPIVESEQGKNAP